MHAIKYKSITYLVRFSGLQGNQMVKEVKTMLFYGPLKNLLMIFMRALKLVYLVKLKDP